MEICNSLFIWSDRSSNFLFVFEFVSYPPVNFSRNNSLCWKGCLSPSICPQVGWKRRPIYLLAIRLIALCGHAVLNSTKRKRTIFHSATNCPHCMFALASKQRDKPRRKIDVNAHRIFIILLLSQHVEVTLWSKELLLWLQRRIPLSFDLNIKQYKSFMLRVRFLILAIQSRMNSN